ncbi:MAG: nucleoside monophosphate kinase [Rickettsiales bacterium]|jgi:adenylate kinase|nr:nucleoside monophosphate kinase [Rickettsiales bacterium]
MTKEVIIFLGPPGSGKGTQAELLKEYGYTSFSTGHLLRKEVEKGSTIGKQIQGLIDKGSLVSDEIILKLCSNEMKRIPENKIIIDGFPRTLNQAELASKYLIKYPVIDLKKVFIFNLDEMVLINRIRNRVSCGKCGATYNLLTKRPMISDVCDVCGDKLISRVDDSEIDSIIKRNKIYNSNICDITYFYAKNNLTFFIDSVKDLKSINQEIKSILNITNNNSEV